MKTLASQAKFLLTILAAILAMLFLTSNAEAKRSWLESFYSLYDWTPGTRLDTCGLCHVNFSQNSGLNEYGVAFKDAGGRSDPINAFIALEKNDPDKDTVSSFEEIEQLFLPGWNCETISTATNAPSYVADYVDLTNPGCWAVTGPAIAATPLALDFGVVEVGTRVSLTTKISNEGDGDLTIIKLSTTGSSDFALGAELLTTPFTVPPGTWVDVLVDYTPGETGDDAGTLEILSDDPDSSSLSVTMAGAGFVPSSLVSDLDIAGLRATKRLSLRRERPAKIKIVVVNKNGTSGSADVTLAGDGDGMQQPFTKTQRVINLAGGERATLQFDYSPSASGVITWTATILDDDPDQDVATAATQVVP